MSISNLEDAFMEELKDILGAERQLLKALPKMARNAENEDLKAAFETHTKQTEGHVNRLEKVFELLGKSARGKKCEAMEGLISEGKELMSEEAEPEALDAMLIAAAQKVEHYEIASYGTVCAWAERLKTDKQIVDLLRQTLAEEKETDQLLTKLATSKVNRQAMTAAQ